MEVYVDGACPRNGTADARAGVGVWFGADSPHNVSRPVTGDVHTNNVAELQAIAAALEALEAMQAVEAGPSTKPDTPGPTAPVTIFTDSMYALNALTLWAPKWARCGWRTAAGGPVANQDLIVRTLAMLQRAPHVTLAYVAGHAGVPGNEGADALARAGAAMV